MKGNLQIEGKENYEQMEEKLWIHEKKAMDQWKKSYGWMKEKLWIDERKAMDR